MREQLPQDYYYMNATGMFILIPLGVSDCQCHFGTKVVSAIVSA